jgi:hypothetical protein
MLRIQAAALAAILAFLPTGARAEAHAEESLHAFLLERVGSREGCLPGEPTQYQTAWFDLNGDNLPDALAYVRGAGWCGTGGCHLLVLERTASGFRERRNLLSRPPIGIAGSKTNGWRDITVLVRGGGNLRPYVAVVPFDGRGYGNPSTPPARPFPRRAHTDVLLAISRYDEGRLLFPTGQPACRRRP